MIKVPCAPCSFKLLRSMFPGLKVLTVQSSYDSKSLQLQSSYSSKFLCSKFLWIQSSCSRKVPTASKILPMQCPHSLMFLLSKFLWFEVPTIQNSHDSELIRAQNPMDCLSNLSTSPHTEPPPDNLLLLFQLFSFNKYFKVLLCTVVRLRVKLVLLHNGGFCNDCITKQCLHLTVEYTMIVSYNDLVSP